MTNKFKTLLKTTAAVATLFAGSQTWGSTIELSSFKNDGTLGPKHAVHGTVAAAMQTIAVPDKALLALGATATVGTSGGIVALGKELYFDIGVTGWTITDLVATENLDVFLRPSTAGTSTTFVFTNLILAAKAQTVKFWTDSGITLTAFGTSNVIKEARSDRNTDTVVSSVDVPTSVPTKTIGGRTYTLKLHYSSQ